MKVYGVWIQYRDGHGEWAESKLTNKRLDQDPLGYFYGVAFSEFPTPLLNIMNEVEERNDATIQEFSIRPYRLGGPKWSKARRIGMNVLKGAAKRFAGRR